MSPEPTNHRAADDKCRSDGLWERKGVPPRSLPLFLALITPFEGCFVLFVSLILFRGVGKCVQTLVELLLLIVGEISQ